MRWIATAEKDTATNTPGDRFMELVKNACRVLLSRGMKGCYVVFLGKETENFVKSRTELGGVAQELKAAAPPPPTVRRTMANQCRWALNLSGYLR